MHVLLFVLYYYSGQIVLKTATVISSVEVESTTFHNKKNDKKLKR